LSTYFRKKFPNYQI